MTPAAMLGCSPCVHLVGLTGWLLPSALITLSMAIGVHTTPLLAMPA